MKEFKFAQTIEQFKTTDCGRFGKAFEINVKTYLNGKRGNSNKVSAKGKTDVRYKGLRLEIKSNCGELDGIEKNDFIVYTYNNEVDYLTPEFAVVLTPTEFLSILDELGLIRIKKSSSGVKKTTIQSYKNSKKKYQMFEDRLSECITLEEWVATI